MSRLQLSIPMNPHGSFGSVEAEAVAAEAVAAAATVATADPSAPLLPNFHPFPTIWTHGGGQKKRFSLPYDFWTTFV